MSDNSTCMLSNSVVSDSATPWTVCSLPAILLSMEFSRQEYWSGLLFHLQGIFPTQGSRLHPLHWQVESTTAPPGTPPSGTVKPLKICWHVTRVKSMWVIIMGVQLGTEKSLFSQVSRFVERDVLCQKVMSTMEETRQGGRRECYGVNPNRWSVEALLGRWFLRKHVEEVR